MPGVVSAAKIAIGDVVQAGQALVLVEAMKMKGPVCAARPGRVRELPVKVGEQVSLDQLMVTTGCAYDSLLKYYHLALYGYRGVMPRIRGSDQDGDSAPSGTPWLAPTDSGWFSELALSCLDRTPTSRVTMIAAMAGSGKSALVRHWLSGPAGRRWVWVDFDLPDRLQPDDVDAVVDRAFDIAADPARISAQSNETVLVLAGLQVLSNEQQIALIERIPVGPRVILLSSGAGLPARCLVQLAGELSEIRAAQLWWTAAEIGRRLPELVGHEFSDDECLQLFRITGGWPAGVILLGRAMSALVEQASVEQDDVLDFVADQVLNRLDPAVRRFVLRTCVLAELEAGLCAVLAPEVNPHAMLAEVRRQGLTTPSRQYPPLVRAAALRALRCEQAGAEAELRRAVGEHAWHRGQPEPAMSSFIEGEDWERAIDVLAASAPGGFAGWQPLRLAQNLTRLPHHSWAGNAERRALFALATAISGNQLRCAEVIRQTPATLIERSPWWPALTSIILALRDAARTAAPAIASHRSTRTMLAEVAHLDDDCTLPALFGTGGFGGLGETRGAVDRAGRAGLQALTHLLAARAALLGGDLPGSRQQLASAAKIEDADLPQYAVLAGLGVDALGCAWGGSLEAAQRRTGRALRLADQAGLSEHPMIGLALLAEVEVLRARGRASEALSALDASAGTLHRIEPFVSSGSGGQLHAAAERILRAALLMDQADPQAAATELKLLAATGDDDLPPALESARAVALARIHLHANDVAAADLVLRAAPPSGAVAATRVGLALQRYGLSEARTVMQSWPAADTTDNRLRLLLASAAIDLALDRRSAAGRGIDEALALAEPDGHLQVFLEAVPGVRVLTSVLLGRSPGSSSWRQELADRLDDVRLETDSGSAPVTRRELAVLGRLTSSLTHAQIASAMFVSENTLKSHCRNLYRKLGVNSRADAVRAARARGWLEVSSAGDVVLDVNITPEPVVVEL